MSIRKILPCSKICRCNWHFLHTFSVLPSVNFELCVILQDSISFFFCLCLTQSCIVLLWCFDCYLANYPCTIVYYGFWHKVYYIERFIIKMTDVLQWESGEGIVTLNILTENRYITTVQTNKFLKHTASSQ